MSSSFFIFLVLDAEVEVLERRGRKSAQNVPKYVRRCRRKHLHHVEYSQHHPPPPRPPPKLLCLERSLWMLRILVDAGSRKVYLPEQTQLDLRSPTMRSSTIQILTLSLSGGPQSLRVSQTMEVARMRLDQIYRPGK